MNLYLSKKGKQRQQFFIRLKTYFIFIFTILLFVSFYYLITELSFFKITEIKISGQLKSNRTKLIQEAVLDIGNNQLAQLLGFDNIFSWSDKKLNLSNNFLIAEAYLNKDLINRVIEIKVKEREKYGLLCQLECYWFDRAGIIFEVTPVVDGNLFFKIESVAIDGEKITLGNLIMEKYLFENLKNILETLKNKVSVEFISWNRTEQDLEIKLNNGPELFFSLRFDQTNNLSGLLSLLDQKNIFNKLFYIDLRSKDKIYYK